MNHLQPKLILESDISSQMIDLAIQESRSKHMTELDQQIMQLITLTSVDNKIMSDIHKIEKSAQLKPKEMIARKNVRLRGLHLMRDRLMIVLLLGLSQRM